MRTIFSILLPFLTYHYPQYRQVDQLHLQQNNFTLDLQKQCNNFVVYLCASKMQLVCSKSINKKPHLSKECQKNIQKNLLYGNWRTSIAISLVHISYKMCNNGITIRWITCREKQLSIHAFQIIIDKIILLNCLLIYYFTQWKVKWMAKCFLIPLQYM